MLFHFHDYGQGLETHPQCMKYINDIHIQLLWKRPLVRDFFIVPRVCSWILRSRRFNYVSKSFFPPLTMFVAFYYLVISQYNILRTLKFGFQMASIKFLYHMDGLSYEPIGSKLTIMTINHHPP